MVKIFDRDTASAAEKMSIIRLFPNPTTHQHAFYELIYVFQGSATRVSPDTNISVKAGDFYLMPPMYIHGYTDQQNFEVFSCLFMPECIDRAILSAPVVSSSTPNRFLRFDILEDHPVFDRILHDFDGAVRPIIRRMWQEHANCQSGYAEMLRCLLSQILIYAFRACESRSPQGTVTQVIEFLKVHYAETVSLDSLSQLVGYTPQYLSSLFSHEIGMTIQACLQHIRVEKSCVLLSQTDLSTAEVAAAVGYQDSRHFVKIFRRYQRISPQEYRKEHKQ